MRNPSASMLRAAGQSPCTHLVNEPTNPTNTLATSILQTRGNQRAERDWAYPPFPTPAPSSFQYLTPPIPRPKHNIPHQLHRILRFIPRDPPRIHTQ